MTPYKTTHLDFPGGGGGRMLLFLISSMYQESPEYTIGYLGDAHQMDHYNIHYCFDPEDPFQPINQVEWRSQIDKSPDYKFYYWHNIGQQSKLYFQNQTEGKYLQNCNYIKMLVTEDDFAQINFLRIIKNELGDGMDYVRKRSKASLKIPYEIIQLGDKPNEIMRYYDIKKMYKTFIKIGKRVCNYLERRYPILKYIDRQDILDQYSSTLPKNDVYRFKRRYTTYRAWRMILSEETLELGLLKLLKERIDLFSIEYYTTKDDPGKLFTDTTNILFVDYRSIITNPEETIQKLEEFYGRSMPSPSINFYKTYLRYNEDLASVFIPSLNWKTGDFKWT